MEMDNTRLDLSTLPPGELRFLTEICDRIFPAYGAGFEAELATLRHLSFHFLHLNEFANIALLRMGSGGRFEGAAVGETEFVLLTKDSMGDDWEPPEEDEEGHRIYPPAYFGTLVETSSSDIVGVGLTPYMKVSLEHKRLDGSGQLSYYEGVSTPYPGRILEGEYVAGNRDLVTEARRKVFEEIVTDPKIIKGMKKDLRKFKKVCDTGVSRNVLQFDLDDNVLFFDPPNRQQGLKYGLMRYVQTARSIQLFELFQRKNLAIDAYLDLNQSVEERIRYAFRKNWVAREEDIIIVGIFYIMATDVSSTAKIRHYTDGSTVYPISEFSLRKINQETISLLDNRLLID